MAALSANFHSTGKGFGVLDFDGVAISRFDVPECCSIPDESAVISDLANDLDRGCDARLATIKACRKFQAASKIGQTRKASFTFTFKKHNDGSADFESIVTERKSRGRVSSLLRTTRYTLYRTKEALCYQGRYSVDTEYKVCGISGSLQKSGKLTLNAPTYPRMYDIEIGKGLYY